MIRLRNVRLLIVLTVSVLVGVTLLAGLQGAYAVQIPAPGSVAFIQTNGPNANLGSGDYYTNTNGGILAGETGAHIVEFYVPCVWPANIPVTVALYDPESQVPNPVSPPAFDQIDGRNDGGGTPDNTTFSLTGPGDQAIKSVVYTPTDGTNGRWVEFLTFDPYDTSGPFGCGTYTLETTTSANDEQSWRLAVNHDPDCSISTGGPGTCTGISDFLSTLLSDGNETDDPDNSPGTGDELAIGLLQVTFEHTEDNACQTFYFFVDGAPVTVHNFDMDNQGTITYRLPTGDTLDGQISGNAAWNGGSALPLPPARVGQTFNDLTPDQVGWWQAEVCINGGNQYIFEGLADKPVFYQQPATPVMEVSKDDGVTVTRPNNLLTYTIVFTNTSDQTPTPGAAANVVLTDTLPPNATYVSCAINAPFTGRCDQSSAGVATYELDQLVKAGESGSVELTVRVNPDATDTVVNEVRLDYRDILGNRFPPVSDDDVNIIPANLPDPPNLTATKRVVTLNSEAVAPCEALTNETLQYTVVVSNDGGEAATNVTFTDTPDANTTLVVGSVQTSQGRVTTGNAPGDTTIGVDIGTIDVGASVTITYQATVGALPASQVTIENQGLARGNNVDDVQTDDPTTAEIGDSTRTVACRAGTTAIVLESFTATRQGDTVAVRWVTSAEINTLGFHLYRSTDGSRTNATRVTPDLILGAGRGQGGTTYTWTDTDIAEGATYTYWLQEVEVDGSSNEYGPATAGAPQDLGTRVFLPLIIR